MHQSFHLSIAVKSIDDSDRFFTDVLGNHILHKDPSGYVNIDFFGAELTLKPKGYGFRAKENVIEMSNGISH